MKERDRVREREEWRERNLLAKQKIKKQKGFEMGLERKVKNKLG